MHLPSISSDSSCVETHRKTQRHELDASMAELVHWLTKTAPLQPLHQVVQELLTQLTALALTALALWSALCLDEKVPRVRIDAGTSYTLHAWRWVDVRTRFGLFQSFEPVYLRVKGKGPRHLRPHARRMGLAAGRMSLGVHVLVADLVARMPFGAVRQVADTVGVWVPGKRAMLGIVDLLGPEAMKAMHNPAPPKPEEEGTHVIIEQDDGGIPHVHPEELKKRRRPNKRKTRNGKETRLEGRRRRRGERVNRRRRQTGDKSKNCRMATVYAVYTLKVHKDNTVEGPLNRQVFAATRGKVGLRQSVLRAAKARGWGDKPSIYLADGAACHWTAWKKYFHQGTPCVDWYHVSEYLWKAADAVYRHTLPAPKGKRPRQAYNKAKELVLSKKSKWVRARQDELLAGKTDDVLRHVQALAEQVGSTGPGTRTRREAIKSATTYLENHRPYLTYSKIGHIVMGTGVIEGTIKQLGARLKGPGMRWSVERAERVLAMRCLQLSGAWEGFAAGLQEAHEAVTSLHVPAISPTEVVTAHKAVRKAA